MSTSINRRSFLKTSAAFAAAATVLPMTETIKPVWAQAPSDRLRMGCIGVGSMGRGDAHGFNHLCDIVAICDLDEDYGLGRTIRSGIGKKNEKGETITPDTYKDYRKVLERDDIDVVTVVTPDHWHVKIAVEALQAGKHVFCQKPLTKVGCRLIPHPEGLPELFGSYFWRRSKCMESYSDCSDIIFGLDECDVGMNDAVS